MRVLLLLAALLPAVSWADLSQPGPYAAGWQRVSVARPNSTTFSAYLFYPALARGSGAAYRSDGAPYPAISFGHGFLQPVTRYQSTLEHLATHGYFVIASESEGSLFPSHANFANDMRLCLTWLEQQNGNPASWLFGQLAIDRFGLSGHSMGGGCSLLAASGDSRIRAVANLAAAETNPSAIAAMPGIRAPVSLISGSSDTIVPVSTNGQRMYDAGFAPKTLPVIQGGWHCGFEDSSSFGCDSGPLSRAVQLQITRRLLTEFFNLYLKGDATLAANVWSAPNSAEVVRQSNPGLVVQPSSAEVQIIKKSRGEIALQLANTAREPAHYAAQAANSGWLVSISPNPARSLSPGESQTIYVKAVYPSDTEPLGNLVEIDFYATSDPLTRVRVRLLLKWPD